jgi:hypothetical protein
VQSPVSKTLLLSADPACTVPGGDKITFPPAALPPPPAPAEGILVSDGFEVFLLNDGLHVVFYALLYADHW